jgi:hypothetical protein
MKAKYGIVDKDT